MRTTYKLNARELTSGLITSIQNVYLDRDIEIIVREVCASPDETAYLSQSPENARILDKAIASAEQGKNLVSFGSIEEAIRSAEEQALK